MSEITKPHERNSTMSKSRKTYTNGYCVGTDTYGNDWAWAKTNRKFGSKRYTFYHVLRVRTDSVSLNTFSTLVEQFDKKEDAIEFCKAQCVTLY